MAERPFIHDDFLLQSRSARELYHGYAKAMPIIDYHCHLPPDQIAQNLQFENMSHVWLAGDHYKWRAMRTDGVDERYCTGGASDWEKFEKWAETMPHLLRNPLYHWSHLELARYFDINDLFGTHNAAAVYEKGNALLAKPEFSCRGLMEASDVRLVCTTDDPVDSLEHHIAIAQDASFKIAVLPTWRPDKGMAVDDPATFNAWVGRLEAAADTSISTLDEYRAALAQRHDFFHAQGCRLADHGVEEIYSADYTESEITAAFAAIRGGAALDASTRLKFKSAMLYEFGVMNHAKGWVQQYHIGAIRNNSTRLFKQLGPDTGFDSIGDFEVGKPMSKFFARLDETDQLSKTIIYSLNPRDNYLIGSMLGNFQDGSAPGKMQMGSGWWFLDQLDGMKMQMEALSQLGLLSRFVGMLTDSRSFLSYTRHEYFRRLLCNILGEEIEQGLLPNDLELVGGMVRDISYNNAKDYFPFDVPEA